MTEALTEALTRTPTQSRSGPARSARRIASLARAEALLLRRSPLALLNAVVGPVVLVVMVRFSLPPGLAGGVGATIVTSLIGFALLLPVYYNLVTVLVARREELVLKRLRTGEATDVEILTGAAAPAVAVAWGQSLVGFVAALTVFGMDVPVNPVLVLAALVLGTAVFVLLAAASTALTSNVEMAQMTTTPVLVVSMVLSGLMMPLDLLPEPVQRIAQVLPATPVVDLLRLGLTGTTPDGTSVDLAASFGPAAVPVLVLAAWMVAGVWATRRRFRWEPRR